MKRRLIPLLAILLTLLSIQAHCGNRLENKVALITGASQGIGRGIANVFAKEGAHVVLLSRTEENLMAVESEIKKAGGCATYIVGDITSQDDMNNAVANILKEHGKLDILVHNAAGLFPATPVENMSADAWHHAIRSNLDAVYYAVKAVIPTMKEQNYGRIVFTSSISGNEVGLPNKSHYCASKGGMNGFMKAIAIELAKYNITVNAVSPGNIITEGLAAKNSPEAIAARAAPIPLGRLGTPEETAYAHLFLASDEASFITGQAIVVDGGQVLPETHFDDY